MILYDIFRHFYCYFTSLLLDLTLHIPSFLTAPISLFRSPVPCHSPPSYFSLPHAMVPFYSPCFCFQIRNSRLELGASDENLGCLSFWVWVSSLNMVFSSSSKAMSALLFRAEEYSTVHMSPIPIILHQLKDT